MKSNLIFFRDNGSYETGDIMGIKFTRLMDQLSKDEGFKTQPYKDPAGKLTIGVGRNLEDNGLSEREVRILLMNDIDRVITELDTNYPFFVTLNDVRQEVLVNMCFNLGLPKFMGFKKMLEAVKIKDFKTAAEEMKNSKWFEQVGERAVRMCKQMESGVY